MRTWIPFVAAALVLAGVGMGAYRAADDAKVSTKEVMKKLHKSDLFKSVVEGKAGKDDKEKVVSLYEALAKNKPSKGDEKDWTERTTALVAAAKGVAAGEDGALEKLNKAANCKGCHSLHK